MGEDYKASFVHKQIRSGSWLRHQPLWPRHGPWTRKWV